MFSLLRGVTEACCAPWSKAHSLAESLSSSDLSSLITFRYPLSLSRSLQLLLKASMSHQDQLLIVVILIGPLKSVDLCLSAMVQKCRAALSLPHFPRCSECQHLVSSGVPGARVPKDLLSPKRVPPLPPPLDGHHNDSSVTFKCTPLPTFGQGSFNCFSIFTTPQFIFFFYTQFRYFFEDGSMFAG